MAAPDPSRLDANQVLQGSFDESTGRLRTDSLATVVNADIDVSLDATEDNVAIADPDGDFLDINDDGSINVDGTDEIIAELQSVNSELDGQTIQNAQIITELQTLNTSTDNIELDVDAIRVAVQSIDTDFDVALSTRATEATQLANNSELQDINSELDSQTTLLTHIDSDLHSVNSSLDAIEEDTDDIRIAIQSIDSDIDVPLSTRATEVTQLSNNQELQDLNVRLETNNNLYSRILPVLTNANFLKLGNFDSIEETFLGNVATLSYKEDTFEIAKATITFNSPTDWNMVLERYILDDDGSKLLDDNDTDLFLE
jgi:outer membrane murein-binding lipoprotein Lpp